LDLFKLVGSVFIDTDKANESLAKTDEKAEKTGGTFKDIAKKAAGVGTAVVGASAAAVGGLVKMASNSASTADEIDKMSQKLGMSREGYQEWDYVLSQAGVDINSMETGMKTLTNQIGNAKSGSDKAAKQFEQLGISMDDINNLSREDIFEKVVSGFQRMEDSTERAALANALFGKSGQNLTPLFNETAESTQELIDKTHDLGMILSDETIDAGVNLTDTMDTLQRSFSTIVTKLGGSLMPIVETFANLIIEFLPFVSAAFEDLAPLLQMVFENLMPPLMELAQNLFPVIMDFISQLLPPIIELVSALLPVIVNLIDALLPILQPILDILLMLLPPLIDIINVVIVPIINLLSQGLKVALQMIGQVISVVANAFIQAWNWIKKTWDGAGKFFSNIWQGIKRTFSAVGTFFTNIFKGAWDGIKKIWDKVTGWFSSLWDGIKNVFKAGLNGVISFLNTMIRGVNILLTPLRAIIAAVGKMFGASWTMDQVAIPEIPQLAKGGQTAGTALVGEQGPELVDLPSGSTVIPLNRSSISLGIDDMNEKMDQLITLMSGFVNALQAMGVYLDGRALVGHIAPDIDRELGRIALREGRYV